MKESDTWETRRQKLINFLEIQKATLDLRQIMRELEYSNKRALLNDIMSILKTLRNKGKDLIIDPPSCIACGFIFQVKVINLKIPSKCQNVNNKGLVGPQ